MSIHFTRDNFYFSVVPCCSFLFEFISIECKWLKTDFDRSSFIPIIFELSDDCLLGEESPEIIYQVQHKSPKSNLF